jgi:hypothetical protein
VVYELQLRQGMMTMKEAASRAAQEFARGRGRSWAWIADRDMIIDAECTDQTRAAHGTGGTATSDQIMMFRTFFIEAIAKKGFTY